MTTSLAILIIAYEKTDANGKHYAVIADYDVDVVDVTNPASPSLVATIHALRAAVLKQLAEKPAAT